MSKKFLIILISILIIVIITLIFINKRNEKIKDKNKIEIQNETSKIESNYDENTSLYYVRDEKTGEIIGASRDEEDLKFYEENPDYNPNPLQTRPTDIEDYTYFEDYANEIK